MESTNYNPKPSAYCPHVSALNSVYAFLQKQHGRVPDHPPKPDRRSYSKRGATTLNSPSKNQFAFGQLIAISEFYNNPSNPIGENKSHSGQLTGPILFIKHLIDTWNLKESDTTFLLGYESTDHDYVSKLLSGHEQLTGRDVKDRIFFLIQIRANLSSLINDDNSENSWLRDPQEELKNRSPMSLMLSGTMENLLLVRDFVDNLAGR